MKKTFVLMALAVLGTFLLAACGKTKKIEVWVGTESETFYREKAEDFKAAYEEKHGKKLGYQINIIAMDTGAAATTFMDDPSVGADLFTVAHDNLGKLISGSSAIAPVQSEALLAQIRDDNPDAFIDAATAVHSGQTYVFGIPYVSQSLVLYYDKSVISEDQVKTWEGMMEAAEAVGKKAMTIVGEDGFNNSFLLLARNAATNATTLKLFPNGVAENSFGSGDDTVAIMSWGQWFFSHPNGGKLVDSDGWEVALKNGVALSVISGAWHYNGAKSALGSKLGIALLPKFTIRAEDAYGTVPAGTVFQSGTFADTKMFVMKKGMSAEKQAMVEELAMYFSSKEVQEESFVAANNLPAYKNAAEEFEAMQGDTEAALLARIQIGMFENGISQPFGKDPKFNPYYYSKGGPAIIIDILKNAEGKYGTKDKIKQGLQVVERIWQTGEQE